MIDRTRHPRRREPAAAETGWPALQGLRAVASDAAAWVARPDKLRFLVVSVTCAALHNAVMIGGDLAGVHYVVSILLSYIVVVTVGYALHAAYTFRRQVSIGSALRYAAAMTANSPMSVLLIFLLYDLAALPMPVAAPLATAIMLAWNFAASRWAIASRPLEA